MNTSRSVLALGLFVAALAPRAALAQTVFTESEPNDTRATATVVAGMTDGDALTGVSIQGTPSLSDWFRISTAPLPPGIYRHRLTLTSGPSSSHSAGLIGRGQSGTPGVGGVAQNNEVTLLWSESPQVSTGASPFIQWYGFGKQEQIYYRVIGTNVANTPYTVTLSTTQVEPGVIPPAFESSAPITIATYGVFDGVFAYDDTEILLYDAALNPVPGALNDGDWVISFHDEAASLTRTFSPGTYYLVVAGRTATDQLAPSDDGFPFGPLTWFPNSLVAQEWQGIWHFKITGSNGTYAQFNYAAPPVYGGVAWWKLTVAAGVPSPPPPLSICEGVACPCGNDGAAGRGCGNTLVASGALLDTAGTPSVSADSLDLLAHDIAGPCLFFQAASNQLAQTYGDGVLCQSGALARLGVAFPASGTAAYSASGAGPIHVVGGPIAAGGMKYYQSWYRDSIPFCTSATFNLTNALLVTWVP